jgi:hypothetical protein
VIWLPVTELIKGNLITIPSWRAYFGIHGISKTRPPSGRCLPRAASLPIAFAKICRSAHEVGVNMPFWISHQFRQAIKQNK